MKRSIRRRLTFANAASSAALFVALGGVGWAAIAPAGSVVTASIRSNAVTTAKIRPLAVTATRLSTGSVTTPKLASGSVTSSKLAAGSVGAAAISSVPGSKVSVGTLATVPRAAAVTNRFQAARLVGVGATDASATVAQAAAPEVALFTSGPFVVYGKCFKSGGSVEASVHLRTTVAETYFQSPEDGTLTTLLTPSTPVANTEAKTVSTGADSINFDGTDFPALAVAPSGATLTFDASVAAKEGSVPAADTIFTAGDTCMFSATGIAGSLA